MTSAVQAELTQELAAPRARRSREENKAKARALWAQGNRTAAFECYNRAVDISPAVAKAFIDVRCRALLGGSAHAESAVPSTP